MNCVRCIEAGSNLKPVQKGNPILTCSICHRAWHYKCIIPPMPEHELTSRINASASHIIDDSLEDWICRHCSKKSTCRNIVQSQQATSSMTSTVTNNEPTVLLVDRNQSEINSEVVRVPRQAWKGKQRAHSSTTPTMASDVIDLTSDTPGEPVLDLPVNQVSVADCIKVSPPPAHLPQSSRRNRPRGTPFAVSPFSQPSSSSRASTRNPHRSSSRHSLRSSSGLFSTPHLDSMLSKPTLFNRTQSPQSLPSSTPSPNPIFSPSPNSGGSSAITSPFTSPSPEVVKSAQSAPTASKVFDLKALIQDMRASGKLNPPRKSLWEEIVGVRTSDAENPTPSSSSHRSGPINDIIMIDDSTELRDVHDRFRDRVIPSDIPMDIDDEDDQNHSLGVNSRVSHKGLVKLEGLPPRWPPRDLMTAVKVEEDTPGRLPNGAPSRRGRKMFEVKKLGPKARKRRQGDLLVIW